MAQGSTRLSEVMDTYKHIQYGWWIAETIWMNEWKNTDALGWCVEDSMIKTSNQWMSLGGVGFISSVEFQTLVQRVSGSLWWPIKLWRHRLLFFPLTCHPAVAHSTRRVCGQGEVSISHLLFSSLAEHYFVPLFFCPIWYGQLPWAVVWYW